MVFRMLLFAGQFRTEKGAAHLKRNSCQTSKKEKNHDLQNLPRRCFGVWEDWSEGMATTTRQTTTILTGDVVDQPALHGLLKRIRDLGLTIIKVERLEVPDETV